MALDQHASSLFTEGRLISPTGYLNANAALFMATALLGASLAMRRSLPLVLRGLLLAIACEGLQLALLAESRGWLFTLPFVLVAALLVTRERLRTAVVAAIPVIGALIPLHSLLHVYEVTAVAHPSGAAFADAVRHAGRISLLCCLGVLILGTLALAASDRVQARVVKRSMIRAAGLGAVIVAIAVAVVGALAATHGTLVRFFNEQWHGFTHPTSSSNATVSHFASTGSERYDAWRVALDAFKSHPIGGLGQDNFSGLLHGPRANRDRARVRSQLGAAVARAHGDRRLRDADRVPRCGVGRGAATARAARLASRSRRHHRSAAADRVADPRVGRLVLGDARAQWPGAWLSGDRRRADRRRARRGPARLQASRRRWNAGAAVGPSSPRSSARRRSRRPLSRGVAYLSVREVSIASDLRASNTARALAHLKTAADLNPYDSEPGRLGVTIALLAVMFTDAQQRFRQSTARQPGGWFSSSSAPAWPRRRWVSARLHATTLTSPIH